jgi:hypothetical protein
MLKEDNHINDEPGVFESLLIFLAALAVATLPSNFVDEAASGTEPQRTLSITRSGSRISAVSV